MGANIPRRGRAARASPRRSRPTPRCRRSSRSTRRAATSPACRGTPSRRALTLKNQPPPTAEHAFAGRGALVLRAGIGVNFGIVADVTADPLDVHLPSRARHDTRGRRGAGRRGRRRRGRARPSRRSSTSPVTARHRATRTPASRRPRCRRRRGRRPTRCRSTPASRPGAPLLMFGHLRTPRSTARPRRCRPSGTHRARGARLHGRRDHG